MLTSSSRLVYARSVRGELIDPDQCLDGPMLCLQLTQDVVIMITSNQVHMRTLTLNSVSRPRGNPEILSQGRAEISQLDLVRKSNR